MINVRGRRILIVFGCLLLAFAVLLGHFCSTEIFTTCGEMHDITEYQIPLTNFTYFTTRRTSPTPFSIAVARAGLVSPNHTHQWLYASGGGNGVICAIGDGRHLYNAVISPEVATFLQATATYRGRAAAQSWTKALLDPKRSDDATSGIRSSGMPTSGFPDKAAYDNWLLTQSVPLDDWLNVTP
jgi:hypothetical protein